MSVRRWLLIVVCCLVVSAGWAAGGTPLDTGKQLDKAGQSDQALAVFLEGIKSAPSEELYREAGSLLGKMQKYDQAISLLEEALQKYPESTPLMNLLGLIKFKTGATEEAAGLWEKVLVRNPNNSFAKDWLPKTKKAPASAVSEPLLTTSTGGTPEEEKTTALVGDLAQKLPLAEQETLAKQLYKDMAALDKYDLPGFDNMHRTVIRKCPDTDFAQQSCWRLSNLYLMANDAPDHEGVIELLEHLIKTYPDSLLVPEAKNRILQSYRATGQSDKVVVFYEELFKLNPNPDERDFMAWALEYADALARLDRKDQARGLYEKVIQMDNNRDQLEARVARDKLAGL